MDNKNNSHDVDPRHIEDAATVASCLVLWVLIALATVLLAG